MIKAVIFDLDGLMIDSERFHFKAYKKFLSKFNVVFNIENYIPYFGVSDADISIDLINKFKLPITKEELMEKKNKIFKSSFIKKVTLKRGLLNLLKKLHKNNYSLAVASSSHIDEIKTILSSLKISHFFKSIISVDFIKDGKPAPDIFLLAAKNLNIKPEDCLVLEDAPGGVIAAKKAGMKCYAIPSTENKDNDFSKADRILNSLGSVYLSIKKDS